MVAYNLQICVALTAALAPVLRRCCPADDARDLLLLAVRESVCVGPVFTERTYTVVRSVCVCVLRSVRIYRGSQLTLF